MRYESNVLVLDDRSYPCSTKKTVNMKLVAKLMSISKVTVEGNAIVWVGFSL